MKKIMILTTGGTIFSQQLGNGLAPSSFKEIKKYIDLDFTNTLVDFKELMVLDSSNIQPEEWLLIAGEVEKIKTLYDGIIITHGTDTLAYSASMLSYLLSKVKIPIVFTGSQISILKPLSDAHDNLKLAIEMAKSQHKGVFVAFNRKIILGTRAVKVRTTDFNAFESINMRNYGELNSYGLILNENIKPINHNLISQIETNVFLLKLTPTTNPSIIDYLISSGIKGIVIEAYGAGGISYIRRDFSVKIENAIKNNIPVVVCSQCLYEKSDFEIYEVGKKQVNLGVIQAYDMTTEATITKLMWALGQTNNMLEIKQIFNTNFVGEIEKG